jgi:hypothetical protein
MTKKIRQELLAPAMTDGRTLSPAPNTNVTQVESQQIVKHVRMTLTDFVLSVAAAQDYGGTKICDLPDTNIMLLGVEADLVITKGGTTNGLVAATDLDVAVGTAVASNATLATTMINVLEKVDLNDNDLVVDFEAHSNDNSTSTFPLLIADSATAALYLNIAASITADDTASVDGTIDIFYIDLGNLAS